MIHRYLLVGVQWLFLAIVVLISFYLLMLGKVADLLSRNYRVITGTDPIGARQVIQGAMGVVTWVAAKIRGAIAYYVRSYHPRVWQRLRDYLVPRR